MASPVGVKMGGGILDQVMREVEIECLPADIPSHINVDVTNLAFGDVLRVSDLPHGGKFKFLDDENATIAHVVSIKAEVEPTVDAVAARYAGRTGSRQEGQAGRGCRSRCCSGRRQEGGEEVIGGFSGTDQPASRTSDAQPGVRSGKVLVVGLGNPGIEYQFTPHNAGFLAIDRIAGEHGAVVANRHCRSLTATVRIASRDVVLAKPETFMNLSGTAVQALVREYEVDPQRDLIVLYDEVAFPLGTCASANEAVPEATTE